MVARRIESLVRSGDLTRGSRLPSEPRLAEMLDVSRASLREALKGLVFLGLLKARAGDGTYLQPSLSSMATRHLQWMLLLDEIKYLELYELREVLEPAVAALAARRATRDDLEQMRSALDGMKRAANDPRAFVEHEMDFHNAITRASKNGAIQSTMQMMYGAFSEGKHRVLPLVHDLARHCARHERIFRLIASGDATGARRAINNDVRYAESLLRQNLQDLQKDDPHRIRRKPTKRMAESRVSRQPPDAKSVVREKHTLKTFGGKHV
ncbi:MAG TPA: FCD domain-containing protein [Acidobacteriaceae bacterium]